MIDAELILERLILISGIDAGEATKWLPVCEAASCELSSKIKKGVSLDDPRIIYAAAAITNYRVQAALTAGGTGVESFKAGDISITENNSARLKAAEQMKKEALMDIAGLLNDDPFIFIRSGG